MLKKKQIEVALSRDEKRGIRGSTGTGYLVTIYPVDRYFDIIRAINDIITNYNATATVEGDNITLKYYTGKIELNIAHYPPVVVNEIIDIIFQCKS